MIIVVDDWRKLPREASEQARRVPLTDPSIAMLPAPSALGIAARAAAARDLAYQGRAGGAALVLGSGSEREQFPRRHLYAIVPVDVALEGAGALSAGIVERHGAGRWWSTGEAVVYVGQGEGVARVATIEGVPHVVLAAYYFWAPPVAPRPYAPGEKMTDRHPDSVIAQVVEETIAERMAKEGALCIEPWMKPAPIAPELLAQRDQMVRESFENCGAPALASDCGHAVRDLGCAMCFHRAVYAAQELRILTANHHTISAAPRRPDGFDQHQVDAAKAALLAPAPPRYPRAR